MTNKQISRLLDFILGFSGFSGIGIYLLILFDKISNEYIKFVFLPGYILMFIFIGILRLAVNIKDPKEGSNEDGQKT